MQRSLLLRKNVFFYFFILILGFHLCGLWIKYRQRWSSLKHPEVTPAPVKVKIIDSQVLESIRRRQQIVQSDDSPLAYDPKKKSRFLSDKNRSFDRETRARVNAPFKKGDSLRPHVGFLGKRLGTNFRELKRNKVLKNLKLSELGAFGKKYDPFKVGAAYMDRHITGANKKSPAAVTGSTNDYLSDVPLGDFTHLNTTEYKYYGYYHRIKIKLEQFWSRSIQEKAQLLAKSGRSIASAEVVTSLRITMDKDGEITAIKVIGPSGVRELDDAAIESFNDAGPFPNPPQGMIVDGKVEIEWGFVVNT